MTPQIKKVIQDRVYWISVVNKRLQIEVYGVTSHDLQFCQDNIPDDIFAEITVVDLFEDATGDNFIMSVEDFMNVRSPRDLKIWKEAKMINEEQLKALKIASELLDITVKAAKDLPIITDEDFSEYVSILENTTFSKGLSWPEMFEFAKQELEDATDQEFSESFGENVAPLALKNVVEYYNGLISYHPRLNSIRIWGSKNPWRYRKYIELTRVA